MMKYYRYAAPLVVLFLLGSAPVLGQTNDPFVISGEQDYLFDVHRVDEAWSVTQGSSNARIGVQSLTGVRYGHEDLAARTQAPSGNNGVDRPELGYGTEAAGVAGAITNNGRGMAGVARTTELRTYNLLEQGGCNQGDDTCHLFNTSAGAFRFREGALAARMAQARQDPSVKVHLFTYGVPSGLFNDYLGQPAIDQAASQNLSLSDLDIPPTSTDPGAALGQFAANVGTIFRDFCVNGGIFGLLNCSSAPTPLRAFQVETANAVILDDDVVVAPMGDHGPYYNGISYAPALNEHYVVAVGGVELDQANQPMPWAQTVQRPYVDVAAVAKDVVATSGESNTAYRTDFGGTVAAASITAGVASLIKAKRSMLTGEDVEQILERTARDVGTTGHDNITGHGVVDAGAALRYVRDNEFLHKRTTSISNVSTQTADARTVTLNNFGHFTPQGRPYAVARGTLKRFTGRINFSGISPPSAPDVWVRWAGSDGIDTRIVPVDGHYESVSDFLIKSLRVVSVDAAGFTVEGYYWRVTFLDALERPIEYGDLPRSPQNYEVAYTVVTPLPPLSVSISGPSSVAGGETGTWTANRSGGTPPYAYLWEYEYPCPDPDPCPTYPYCWIGPAGRAPQCGDWSPTGTSASLTRSFSSSFGSVRLRVRVTDDEGTVRSAQRTISVQGNRPAGEEVAGAASESESGARSADDQSAAARGTAAFAGTALPSEPELRGAVPNPFHGEAEIAFALPEASEVRLVVFDLLGREVARPVEGRVEAGHHRVRFDGRGLPAGVYVVRLAAGEHVSTVRMTLVR